MVRAYFGRFFMKPGCETESASESPSDDLSTHPQHSGVRNSCAPAAWISGTRTSRRPASGPTLSAGSSPRCPGDGWPGTAGRRCRCTSPPSVCGCRGAESRTPAKFQNNRKYLYSCRG